MAQAQVIPVAEQSYRSDARPDFTPFEVSTGSIRGFAYTGSLASELKSRTITAEVLWPCTTTCSPCESSRR